jgi:hypothetical protein
VLKEEDDMMKKMIIYIIIIVSILSGKTEAQINCDLTIDENVFDINGNDLDYQPGSVICLKPGNKDYLLIENIHGTKENPVTLINSEGTVVINTDHYYGIKVSHCSYIKLSGNGSSKDKYGIRVERVGQGTGLSVGDLSTDVEVEFLEIANTAIAGVYAKTDPTCNDFSSTREKFTMYNFVMHDCYIHDVLDEGLYIGSSKYTGQVLYDCDTVVLPHVLIGTRIYNNIVERTGWDGIQVSSAEQDCEVYNNVIRHNSYVATPGQMSGMIIGGGSRCKVYNNKIYDGYGDGIDLFGIGFQKVFNNLLVRNGQDYNPDSSTDFKHGIYLGKVDDAVATDELNEIFNNTIVSPKSFGITYSNDQCPGKIFNNAILEPGYTEAGEKAFINITVQENLVEASNNYTSQDVYSARFVSVSEDNLDLQPDSPLVDNGFDISQHGIGFDIDNRTRPFHNFYDIGAYECQSPFISINEKFQERLIVYPNPANDHIKIAFDEPGEHSLIQVINLTGQIILTQQLQPNIKETNFSVSDFKNGNYLLVIKNDQIIFATTPLIIKHYD